MPSIPYSCCCSKMLELLWVSRMQRFCNTAATATAHGDTKPIRGLAIKASCCNHLCLHAGPVGHHDVTQVTSSSGLINPVCDVLHAAPLQAMQCLCSRGLQSEASACLSMRKPEVQSDEFHNSKGD